METGLGRWTEEQLVRTFKTGVSPAGFKYPVSPMEWNIYANMKEEDVRAIYRYLRTVKPIPNKKADTEQSAGEDTAQVAV